ncbi:MAG: T9SS type A sorting domain-containing protein, partial [Bacteroidales bacterium]|nr:T9SS type A sorting domain-containing protein [Bacteroidales bacterium]
SVDLFEMYLPGSQVAGWGNQTIVLSGNEPILTAAEMNQYNITGTFTICYTVRAGGNVTDPDASNNKACLTIKRGGVGIDGFNAEEINVYPNPATNVINVANAENAQVSVFDINGKLMVSVESASANQTIDASNFANGLYFVRITDGNNVVTKKINVVK